MLLKEVLRKKTTWEAIFGVVFWLVLFIVVSYWVKGNIELVRSWIISDTIGMIVYVFLFIFETVIAPISLLPLIPIASNLWGILITGLLGVIAWTIGNGIIFFLCKKFRKPVLKRFVSMRIVNEFDSFLPRKHLYANLIILRIILPNDIFSYALGLLTDVKFKTYFITAVIGIIPYSFVMAYLGKADLMYQIIGSLIRLGLLVAGFVLVEHHKNKNRKIVLDFV
jgi:uncharacterized membrane protein YdjX (TVP38/TMEM64 family)